VWHQVIPILHNGQGGHWSAMNQCHGARKVAVVNKSTTDTSLAEHCPMQHRKPFNYMEKAPDTENYTNILNSINERQKNSSQPSGLLMKYRNLPNTAQKTRY
jgi:hypothetical protein